MTTFRRGLVAAIGCLLLLGGTSHAAAPRFAFTFDGGTMFSENDLERVDWPDGRFVLTAAAVDRLHKIWGPDVRGHLVVPDTFVVVVDGAPLFTGRFVSPVVSSLPRGPYVLWPPMEGPANIRLHIAIGREQYAEPMAELRRVLEDAGVTVTDKTGRPAP